MQQKSLKPYFILGVALIIAAVMMGGVLVIVNQQNLEAEQKREAVRLSEQAKKDSAKQQLDGCLLELSERKEKMLELDFVETGGKNFEKIKKITDNDRDICELTYDE